MNPVSIAAIYIILWWIVLFTVLPFGVQPEEPKDGNFAGAPKKPMLGIKLLVTTIITAALTALVCYLIINGYMGKLIG